jgi:tripartite ATP-independent transporter DctM subunit
MTLAIVLGFVGALAVGVPVALSMGVASWIAIEAGGTYPLLVLPQRLFGGINSFPLMAVPLFILAADLMTAGRLTEALLRHTQLLVGHVRGGLGHVNILTSMLFAGISGSALADAAGPGAIIMKMMWKGGYPRYYAGALTATTATIGPIIPPSIIAVIYAVTESSVTVAGLFLAGIVPGVMLGLALAVVNHVMATRHGFQAGTKRAPIRQILGSFLPAVPGLLMPIIILGGILGGIFTATEAAAVAAAYALLVSVLVTRSLKLRDIPGVFLRSGLLTSAVLLIVSMASVFSWLLTILRVPQLLAEWLGGLTDSRALTLVLLAVFILMVGLVIDTLPAVIILTPILAPVAANVGVDPLHFAMILVLNLAIGMVTPPIGPVLFVIATVGGLRLEKVARAVLPLLLAELIVLSLVIAFPQLSLTVPRLFGFTQ